MSASVCMDDTHTYLKECLADPEREERGTLYIYWHIECWVAVAAAMVVVVEYGYLSLRGRFEGLTVE